MRFQDGLLAIVNPTVISARVEEPVCSAVPKRVVMHPSQMVFFRPQVFPKYAQANTAGTLALVRVAVMTEIALAVR